MVKHYLQEVLCILGVSLFKTVKLTQSAVGKIDTAY